MFARFKRFFKGRQINTVVLLTTVVLFAISHYAIVINGFINDHAKLAYNIKQTTQQGHCVKSTYIMEHNVYITNHIDNKKYFIDHESAKCQETAIHDQHSTFPDTLFKLTIQKEKNVITTVIFPKHIEYKFKDARVCFDLSHYVTIENATIILFLIFTIILLLVFKLSMIQSDSQLDNLKISAQEYVLSERTISFLVSIMHHKLNSPIKVISTKTRVLMETIVLCNKDKLISDDILKTSEKNYIHLHDAIDNITKMTNKLKEYNEHSQNETNVYNICQIATDTIEILKDEDFNIEIDYKTKLYEIDTNNIRSHEIIQIFINQIKFSLGQQFADSINFKIFKSTDDFITILYTDNGNQLEPKVLKLIKNRIDVSDLLNDEIEQDYIDLILNFNILNANKQSNIRLLSTNKNGNLFEIKLPTIRNNLS